MDVVWNRPHFHRRMELVTAINRVPDKQHIMKTPKYRALVHTILMAAKKIDASCDVDELFEKKL